MKYFLDCEFEHTSKTLLSIALVAEDGSIFYNYFDFKGVKLSDWVRENVIPIMGDIQFSHLKTPQNLQYFLGKDSTDIEIFCDWPTDVEYFCAFICSGFDCADIRNITFHIDFRLSSKLSEKPHHALYDAIAIKESYYKLNPS